MSAALDASYLNALPSALIAIDKKHNIVFINPSAEILFATSAQQVVGKPISTLIALKPEEEILVKQTFALAQEVSFFERMLVLPQGQTRTTLHISPITANPEAGVEQVLLTIEKPSGLHAATASEWKKEATRAAGVMAAMLAHEVKNPLSGIRGAAQLLKDVVTTEHQALTELICMETDRIRDLLLQVDIFADGVIVDKQPVNIHEVLQHVISVANAGFAREVKFVERYDPSLPPVLAHRDLLVQLFLNLVKNAAEAMEGKKDATLTIATTYRSGYRIRLPQAGTQVALPVMVSISDNGPGIDEPLRAHLFEPFVSSKEQGRGLGLAVVAKIAADLGIVVELDEEFHGGAKFNVMLPCAA